MSRNVFLAISLVGTLALAWIVWRLDAFGLTRGFSSLLILTSAFVSALVVAVGAATRQRGGDIAKVLFVSLGVTWFVWPVVLIYIGLSGEAS